MKAGSPRYFKDRNSSNNFVIVLQRDILGSGRRPSVLIGVVYEKMLNRGVFVAIFVPLGRSRVKPQEHQ